MDLDTDEHFAQLMEIAAATLSECFTEEEFGKFRKAINEVDLRKSGVMCSTWNARIFIAMRSWVDVTLSKFHLIWPFITCSTHRRDAFLFAFKNNVLKEFPEYQTSKLECPRTLRAPFCDKANKITKEPENRPYTLFAVYSQKGSIITPDRDQSPDYPFDVSSRDESYYIRAVWAMSSLRWTYSHPKSDIINRDAFICVDEMEELRQVTACV